MSAGQHKLCLSVGLLCNRSLRLGNGCLGHPLDGIQPCSMNGQSIN